MTPESPNAFKLAGVTENNKQELYKNSLNPILNSSQLRTLTETLSSKANKFVLLNLPLLLNL